MEKKSVKLTEMSLESFRPYGQYMNEAVRDADVDAGVYKFWNRFGLLEHKGPTSFSMVQTYGKYGLIEESLETHLNTSETLIPTEDIIIVLALTDENDPKKPDLDTVKAFPVKRGEAVTMFPGTWHHGPLTKAESANTFIVFKSDTPETDCFLLELKDEFGLYYEVEM